jgi:hypothetical protein
MKESKFGREVVFMENRHSITLYNEMCFHSVETIRDKIERILLVNTQQQNREFSLNLKVNEMTFKHSFW